MIPISQVIRRHAFSLKRRPNHHSTLAGMPGGDTMLRRGAADNEAVRSHEGVADPDQDPPDLMPASVLI